MPRATALAAAFAMLLPAATVAQRAPAALARVRPGATLRVQSPATGIAIGLLLAPIGDTVLLRVSDVPTAIPIATVNTLWERGRATKTGAIVGGAFGGTGLAVLLSIACVITRSDDGVPGNDSQFVDCAALGVALGGLGGGLLGGLIGSAIPKWHTRFRT